MLPFRTYADARPNSFQLGADSQPIQADLMVRFVLVLGNTFFESIFSYFHSRIWFENNDKKNCRWRMIEVSAATYKLLIKWHSTQSETIS